VGGVKLARAYAKVLSTDMVIVDKRRMSPQEAAVGFVIGSVEGKNVLMVDDLVATGGTLAEAAKALKARGARDIYVSATHPVFCGPVVERLKPAPIKEVTVTDTIQLNDKAKALGDRIRVLSIGELLGEAIRRIHLNKSVSSLFNKEV
jgi:ribose-phosphate pyrophosphokinase